MLKYKKLLSAAAAALACAAVSALCVAASMGEFTRCTLTFTVGDTVSELRMRPGGTPDMEDLAAPEGERIVLWLSDGEQAYPEQPAVGDEEYVALLSPAFAEEYSGWLELDEYGLAHPDAGLTGDEAARGVAAMFSGEVDTDALEGLDTVSEAVLGAALEGLFAPEALAGLDSAEPLTRMEAAGILYPLYMTSLYGDAWGFDAVYSVGAPDLDPLAEGADCLAACLDMTNSVRYEPGFVNLDGWLYCADDMGLFYMDETVDGFYFGPDGRYSSGNERLDELVAAALAPICAGCETREDMLRAAYLYVRDSFDYLRRNYYEVGDEGWESAEAVTMLATQRGNCYNYAAAFWALARGLGFDATAVSGTVGWARSPHGWVIMYDDAGERLIYDVELEMAYIYDRGLLQTDFYAMNGAKSASLNYIFGEQFQ